MFSLFYLEAEEAFERQSSRRSPSPQMPIRDRSPMLHDSGRRSMTPESPIATYGADESRHSPPPTSPIPSGDAAPSSPGSSNPEAGSPGEIDEAIMEELRILVPLPDSILNNNETMRDLWITHLINHLEIVTNELDLMRNNEGKMKTPKRDLNKYLTIKRIDAIFQEYDQGAHSYLLFMLNIALPLSEISSKQLQNAKYSLKSRVHHFASFS